MMTVVHCYCFTTGQLVECLSKACAATSILTQSYTICAI